MDNPNSVLPDNRAALQISGYLPNGVRVFFTVNVDLANAYGEALDFTNRLLSQGFSTNAPGLENGEERELIVTVMRREKGDGTPIIDFYPAWGAGGDEPFGTYKYVHKYLNNEAEIADFLTVSGLKSLEDIPLYDGQAPLKRTASKVHPKEKVVPKPFYTVRKQGAEKTGSDGKPYRPWELLRYESELVNTVDKSTGEIQNGNPPAADEGKLTVEQWNSLKNEFGADFVAQVLQVKKGSDWKGSYAAAREAVLKHQVPF